MEFSSVSQARRSRSLCPALFYAENLQAGVEFSQLRRNQHYMQEDSERWKYLAKMAANEQDPAKLFEIIRELNELLAKKKDRLDHLPKSDSK